MGADFNIEPETIADTGLLEATGGRIATAAASTATCIAATPASNIDHFMPVWLHWKPKMQEIRIRTLRTKKLSSAIVVGPLPKPQAWNESIAKSRQLHHRLEELAKEGMTPGLNKEQVQNFHKDLDEVYSDWNNI